MSVYFNKRREWWEYYFRHQKKPYTGAGFTRKKDALAAEAKRKEEVKKPMLQQEVTDMAFLDLCNYRLDFLEAYRSDRHYTDTKYLCKAWTREWQDKSVFEITTRMIQKYLIRRCKEVSPQQANKELVGLKALFNFGIKPPNRWFNINPTDGLTFFPVEKKKKYVPPVKDVIAVFLAASGEVQDYLWTIALTMGRMSEINRLKIEDVDFNNEVVTLHSRKTKNGNLVPRDIPMTNRLREVLQRRIKGNNTPWVFPHTYHSRKAKAWVTGPYTDRKRIMKTLCAKAGVKYFRFHPIRHFGASQLLKEGIDIKTIQNLLGHADLKTTDIYLHSIGRSDKAAMDKLELTLDNREEVVEFEKRKTYAQD